MGPVADLVEAEAETAASVGPAGMGESLATTPQTLPENAGAAEAAVWILGMATVLRMAEKALVAAVAAAEWGTVPAEAEAATVVSPEWSILVMEGQAEMAS